MSNQTRASYVVEWIRNRNIAREIVRLGELRGSYYLTVEEIAGRIEHFGSYVREVLDAEGVIRPSGDFQLSKVDIRRRKRRERHKQRQCVDDAYRFRHKIISAIGHSLKWNRKYRGGRYTTVWDKVGYTREQAVEYLKGRIPEGYTWWDFLEGRLELDHKYPVRVYQRFYIDDPGHPSFRECWSLENLQLLPRAVNRKKKDRVPKFNQLRLGKNESL